MTRHAVVLAAGGSQRMGRPKALLELDGRPVVAWHCERLATIADEVVVVTGAASLAGVVPATTRIVHNAAWATTEPRHSLLLAIAGLGLREAGDLPGCVAAFDRAIGVKPQAPFYTERALCKHEAKDLAGARKDLDESIKIEPSSKSYFYAGKFAEEAGDKKACRAHYLEAAKLAGAAKPGTKVEEEAKKGAERCK